MLSLKKMTFDLDSYPYPDAVSPVPSDTGYNGQSFDAASSFGEIPYDSNDSNGFMSNGYSSTNMYGGSLAASPTPNSTDGYGLNGYSGYDKNGSVVSTNGNESVVSDYNGSGVSVRSFGYNGSEHGGSQFVRRRLLPAIPQGETITKAKDVLDRVDLSGFGFWFTCLRLFKTYFFSCINQHFFL